MNDLQLFSLECLTRSAEVQNVIYTDSYIFMLENEELYMCDLGNRTDFERIAPGQKFNLVSMDVTSGNTLCIGDGRRLHFYDYKIHKLFTYTLNNEFISAAWSPSNELIALITADGKIRTLHFNSDGVLMGEKGENYISNNNPQHFHINFHWDMKHLEILDKLTRSPNTSDDCINFVTDASEPVISWRGTNTMFVVNHYIPSKASRVFKVYSQDCRYLFEGIPILGLQAATAWKPGLSFYLSIPIAKKNSVIIGLFEKSGNLHDAFALRYNSYVSKMEWSNDGNILAILQLNQNQTPISLYHYQHKQWALKQFLLFEDMYFVKTFHWITNDSNIMYPLCVVTNEHVYKYVFRKGSFNTNGHSADHHMAAYATINGNKLELTLFVENVLVLEPTTFEKEFPRPINNIVFHPKQPKLVIMDCDTTLYLCEYSLDHILMVRRYEWDDVKKLPFMLHHMYWGTDDNLYCIGINKDNPKADKLFLGDLKTGSSGEAYFLPFSDIPQHLTYIGYSFNSNIIIEQRHTQVDIRELKSLSPLATISYNVTPITVDAIDIDEVNYIFALTTTLELYINFQKVMTGISSFYIHNGYLLFTKQQGLLMCLQLKNDGIKKLLADDPSVANVYSIAIAVDVVLLTGIPNTPEIVLQHQAQKHFETLRIKPIIIDSIEHEIQKGNWIEAYNRLFEEDLNINILLDLDYARFLDSVPDIIHSIGCPQLLTKLIESINSENVFLSEYKNSYIVPSPAIQMNKVQTVCEKFLVHLAQKNFRQKYITTIATCCIQGFKLFGMKEALYYISSAFDTMSCRDQNFKRCVSQAIHYLRMQKTEPEIFKEILLTFNILLIEYGAHVLNVWSSKFDELLNEIKPLDSVSQRIKIHQYICDGTFFSPSRINCGRFRTSESRNAFDTSPKDISIEKNPELKQAELLESESRTGDACKLYEKCLGHLESTCSLLAKKHSFFGAVRVAKKLKKTSLIERDVIPIAESYCNEMINNVTIQTEEYNKLTAQLIEIREQLLKTVSNNFFDVLNTISVESTSNDFKQKETGSNTDGELEYLSVLRQLHNLIREAFASKDVVREICHVLLANPKMYYRKCKSLHDTLYDFHVKIVKDIPFIWPSSGEAEKSDKSSTDDVLSKCQYLKPPSNVTLTWTLPYFINK